MRPLLDTESARRPGQDTESAQRTWMCRVAHRQTPSLRGLGAAGLTSQEAAAAARRRRRRRRQAALANRQAHCTQRSDAQRAPGAALPCAASTSRRGRAATPSTRSRRTPPPHPHALRWETGARHAVACTLPLYRARAVCAAALFALSTVSQERKSHAALCAPSSRAARHQRGALATSAARWSRVRAVTFPHMQAPRATHPPAMGGV